MATAGLRCMQSSDMMFKGSVGQTEPGVTLLSASGPCSDLISSHQSGNLAEGPHMNNTGAFDLSKLTAVSFAAMRLEIGTWQFIAKTKEAVSATCCYTQRQLTWEVTEAGQRNKIELKWDDITSLRVTPMGPATELLEVDVQQAPALYQETSPSVWQQCHDFTGGEASCLRAHKVLFPSNTVMNLLQDLVLCEPRLAALTTATTGPTIVPGAVIQGTNFSSLPFPPVSSTSLHSLQSSAAAIGMLPSYLGQSSAPLAHMPLYSNMYNTAPSTFNSLNDQTEGFSRGSSMMSNLSCATAAQPQLSNECLSSTNSEDSLLGGLTSSPCYQSSYSGGYINPFEAPNSPSRLPVSPCLGNSALLEQTAAMMKAATAALHSLQSPPHLYHSPQRQQPTQAFTSTPTNQHCYAPPRVSSLPAMPAAPSRAFLPVQTAPSVASIGMQALEELMMSDSSQGSSPFTPCNTLQSVQSAPASLYQVQASQPWAPSLLPPSSHALPTQIQPQQEATAHHSVSQLFDSITQHDVTQVPTPAPKLRTLKRSVSDIPVFDCKAAAAAMAAKEAARALQEAAPAAAQQEPDFADLDLPLIDDSFLGDMGSSDLDSGITSGLCFEGFADCPCPRLDRSDSSSNLLAEQALQCASEEAAPAPKRKGKQSKKLKARGGVSKALAQVHMIRT
ncbi:TPA: hypothetical protein ACH3X1_001006 [Trebouxia sp. C0004]